MVNWEETPEQHLAKMSRVQPGESQAELKLNNEYLLYPNYFRGDLSKRRIIPNFLALHAPLFPLSSLYE